MGAISTMKITDLIIKPLIKIGQKEMQLYNTVVSRKEIKEALVELPVKNAENFEATDSIEQDYLITPKKEIKRKEVQIMKENETRSILIEKIWNGFVFTIQGTIFSEKYHTHASLDKTFFSPTRAKGITILESKLGEFGGELRKKLSKAEAEEEQSKEK